MSVDAVRELLSKIPEPVDRGDDFNPCDWSGGNYDDAYYLGEEVGRRGLAQEIRELLK